MASSDFGGQAARSSEDAVAARLIRRTLSQWWLIATFAIVAGLGGYLLSSSRPEQFESTTTIQLNEIDLAGVFLAQNLQQQGQDAEAKAATNAKLVTFPRVREAASRALGGEVSPKQIGVALSVVAEPATTLINITARSQSPAQAQRIADAVREAFVEIRRQAAVSQFNDARDSLTQQLNGLPQAQRQTASAQLLRDRLTQVETLRAASNGGVETVQTARVPDGAVSPTPRRDAILAFIVGALLGTIVALLRARFDDRIRDVTELSEHWNLPVLGLIPQTAELKDGTSHLASGSALEAFALARTNLRYLHVGGDVKTVVVTSALAEEGKSTVAWNLAVAAAMADQQVLLIDADLRRPVVAERAGITTGRGLSEVLAGIALPMDVVVPTNVPVAGGDVVLDIVPAGLIPPSPIALLERSGTGPLLAELGEGYDLVFIDTPPATVVADAKVILDYADGVVVVSRLGRVTSGALDRLRDLLEGLDTPVLGTVVNSGVSAKAYGYQSYESHTPPQGTAAPVASAGEQTSKKAVESASS